MDNLFPIHTRIIKLIVNSCIFTIFLIVRRTLKSVYSRSTGSEECYNGSAIILFCRSTDIANNTRYMIYDWKGGIIMIKWADYKIIDTGNNTTSH